MFVIAVLNFQQCVISSGLMAATPCRLMLRVSQLLAKSKVRKGRPSDNTPAWDKGPVEWLPRPVRMPYSTLDELRNWVTRAQLDQQYDELNKLRDTQRDWGRQPQRPVLGDYEPRFPKKVYKDNHIARRRFLFRWHRANTPLQWMWLPRAGNAERRAHAGDYPENWKTMRDADALRVSARQQ